MAHKIEKLVAVFALIFMLGGCQAMTGQTLGENVDDTTITTTVKTKLAAEKGSTVLHTGAGFTKTYGGLSGFG
jgi:hypothetical protein